MDSRQTQSGTAGLGSLMNTTPAKTARKRARKATNLGHDVVVVGLFVAMCFPLPAWLLVGLIVAQVVALGALITAVLRVWWLDSKGSA